MDGSLTKSEFVAAGEDGQPETEPQPIKKEHLLVYVHDRKHVDELEAILGFLGHPFTEAFDLDQLKSTLKRSQFLTLIITGNLPEAQQERLVEVLSLTNPDVLPVVLYERPEKEADVLVLAYPPSWTVLSWPLASVEFSRVLQRARARRASSERSSIRPSHLFRSLTGRSRAIQKIRREIEQAGPTDANVLILGESGTGKEVVARNIHYHSMRREKAFVPVNCGAIPRDLLESELFGHEKGAFTGALTARDGRFALAAGGTLFLDEIGEMPMDMQVKLLRVLEDRTFERVGGSRQIKADVRIVAATNCDLERMVAEGKFRGDLFYRLEVFPIVLPALRERIEDMSLLIAQLNERMECEKNCSVDFSTQAMKALSEYPWPGNVRELANLIERLAIQFPNSIVQKYDLPAKYRGGSTSGCENELQLEIFAESSHQDNPEVSDELGTIPLRIPPKGMDMKSYISEIEMQLITQALEETKGVIAHAAKLLGLRRTTLTEKMRKYGLSRPSSG